MTTSFAGLSTTTANTFTVLVTGANSGLGFATCCRLIDEFLATRPSNQSIHLLFSTRDARKRSSTLKAINEHLNNALTAVNGSSTQPVALQGPRVTIEGVLVDLTRLLTVKSLAEQLLRRGQRLDAVVCNAGIGGWRGLNWPRAIFSILFDFRQATTYPTYQPSVVGWTSKPQLQPASGQENGNAKEEPVLGEVFTANVFGHYMLVHWLTPILRPTSRVVWVSSLSAHAHLFDPNDFQRLGESEAYDSSKRVTDLLVLTSELPSTQSYVSSFFGQPTSQRTATRKSAAQDPHPALYLTHPGVVHTAIAGLPWFLAPVIWLAFLLARWIGSPWHTVDAYKGAVSASWVCLAPDAQLADREQQDGKGKWGSTVTVFGDEGVKRTEVDGWGFSGVVGRIPQGSVAGKVGRYRARRLATQELRDEFERLGVLVWRELEDMRTSWEKILGPLKP